MATYKLLVGCLEAGALPSADSSSSTLFPSAPNLIRLVSVLYMKKQLFA